MKRFTITEFREMYPTDDACLDRIFQLRYNNLAMIYLFSVKLYIIAV